MCNKILCDINARMAVGEGYSLRVEEYVEMNRVELMGRLVYCGFEIVEVDEDEVRVRKVKDAVVEECPEREYGWIVKLRRVGKDGRRFNIYISCARCILMPNICRRGCMSDIISMRRGKLQMIFV